MNDAYKRIKTVEARQWFCQGHCPVWAQSEVKEFADRFEIGSWTNRVTIGFPKDWIVKRKDGRIFIMSDDLFKATFEPA